MPWFEVPSLFMIEDLLLSENIAILSFIICAVVGQSRSKSSSLRIQRHLFGREWTILGDFWVFRGYFIDRKRLALLGRRLLTNLV